VVLRWSQCGTRCTPLLPNIFRFEEIMVGNMMMFPTSCRTSSTRLLTKKTLSSLTTPRTLSCSLKAAGHHLQLTKLGQRCHQQPKLLTCGNVLRNFAAASSPPPSYDPPHPPILFDLILRADWKSALKRISSHPIEARYRHPRGTHCYIVLLNIKLPLN